MKKLRKMKKLIIGKEYYFNSKKMGRGIFLGRDGYGNYCFSVIDRCLFDADYRIIKGKKYFCIPFGRQILDNAIPV